MLGNKGDDAVVGTGFAVGRICTSSLRFESDTAVDGTCLMAHVGIAIDDVTHTATAFGIAVLDRHSFAVERCNGECSIDGFVVECLVVEVVAEPEVVVAFAERKCFGSGNGEGIGCDVGFAKLIAFAVGESVVSSSEVESGMTKTAERIIR